jgi:hypothetical protein
MISNTHRTHFYGHNLATKEHQVLLVKIPCRSKNLRAGFSVSENFAVFSILGYQEKSYFEIKGWRLFTSSDIIL